MRGMFLAGAALLFMAGPALADPIEGLWKTGSGNTAEIAPCGGALCITLKTGPHAGKRIGRFEVAGNGSYRGEVTDPANGKTYNGKGRLEGDVFTMSGCLLGRILCRSEKWARM